MRAHSFTTKLEAVLGVRRLIEGGHKQRQACRAMGVPFSSFQTWNAKYEEGGPDALGANYANCGRKAKFELNEIEAGTLKSLVLVHDSVVYAIEQFIKHPDCRPETAQMIEAELQAASKEKRYPRWPTSLRRAASVNVDQKAMLRGQKTYGSLSFSPRKGMFYTNSQGEKMPIHPHTVWSMDDYSTNQPYYIEAEGGYQKLVRQTFATMDLASSAWLSVEMIGRERDAYRAEDILRFILRTIDAQGTMPTVLLLERGRWKSKGVHGLDLKCISEKYRGKMWGALDDLMLIEHGYSSRHKAFLESSFNLLQRALAHSGRDIGRTRGEFERATKDYLKIQSQARLVSNGGNPDKIVDAASKGFLSQDQARELHWQAMQDLNARGRMRSATGLVEVPNDLLACSPSMKPLPEGERWRFLPVKRKVSVRKGFIQLSVTPYPQPFRFQINGVPGADYLPNGYTLLVAFDPTMPALGAYVCNGEVGAANQFGYGLAEYIMTAPYAEDVAQFDLRSGGWEDSDKRRANAAARTSFAGINPMGRRGLAVTAQHRSDGTAVIARTGATAPNQGMVSIETPAEPEAQEPAELPASQAPRQNTVAVPSLDELEAAAFDAFGL